MKSSLATVDPINYIAYVTPSRQAPLGDRVAEERQHHAEGRLTVEELEERTERAYAARTLGDLDALGGDLPPLQRPAAPPSQPVPSFDGRSSPSMSFSSRHMGVA